jgi:tRNA-modifying protein YgfZ
MTMSQREAALDLKGQLGALEMGAGIGEWPLVELLRLAGPDHRQTLNRIVSNEVASLSGGAGALALVLASKGQFRAIVAVFDREGELAMLVPAGRSGELMDGLARYLALSRSRLERTPEPSIAILGPRWREVLEAAGWPVPGERSAAEEQGRLVLAETLAGLPGATAVGAGVADLREAARTAGAVEVTGAAVELARIRGGWPAWGAELTDSVLPPEVGLEEVAISYSKGCYVGQETIARMKTYGRATRQLVGVRHVAGPIDMFRAPEELVPDGEDKARGVLTSAAVHPEHGGVGLAIVRRQHAEPGARLRAGATIVEVTPLPLW